MKRFAAAAILAAASLAAPASAEPLNQWVGKWTNASSDGLVSVTVKNQGGALKVSAQGACTPNPCEWGEVAALAHSPSAGTDPAADTQAIVASWNQGFATKTMVIDSFGSNSVTARVYTHFTDGSGRNDYYSSTALSKQVTLNPGVLGSLGGLGGIIAMVKPFKEDCINFNPDQVEAKYVSGRWKLVQGSMWMLDADQNEDEMRRAEAVVHRYGLSQQCFVGRPDASLSYWLVDGKAPEGPLPIQDCVSINPNGLSVKQNGSIWQVLSNGNHAAFSAPSKAEADNIVAVLKYYGFTQSCFIGRPGPSMSYLYK